MEIRDQLVSVDRQFSLNGGLLSSRIPNKPDLTYIEDVKDPEKVAPPSDNLVLIALRIESPRSYVPLALFDDIPLDLCYCPAIGTSASGRCALFSV